MKSLSNAKYWDKELSLILGYMVTKYCLIDFIGFDYQWLYPVGVFKRDFVNSKDLNAFRQELPERINSIITEGVETKSIQRSN